MELPILETICNNIRSGEEFLNTSNGNDLNDGSRKRLKEMFLNQDRLADVIFKVEGAVKSYYNEFQGAMTSVCYTKKLLYVKYKNIYVIVW